jgi:hypothetical protein
MSPFHSVKILGSVWLQHILEIAKTKLLFDIGMLCQCFYSLIILRTEEVDFYDRST